MTTDTLNINELKDYLKPLIHFGEIEFKIEKKEDYTNIIVLERHNYNSSNDEKENRNTENLTNPFTITVGLNNVIGFINHNFHVFTKANQNSIMHLLNLIGTKLYLT